MIKLVRKGQGNLSVTVLLRKDNYLFPSLDEHPKESFNLAFELAFHSIPLYPAGPLHILTRCMHQKDLANFNLFQNINPVDG